MYIQSYPSHFFVESKRDFIGSIGVEERFRGKGVGKQLLSFTEKYLLKNGINVFDTDVYVFNTAAEALYDGFGFKNLKHYKRKFLAD